MQWKPGPHRTAFTLVELLTVSAVIGTLVALLLPGIQAAREAGRRSVCQERLHQLGLGLSAHENARGAFPRGCLECDYRLPYPRRQIAWNVFLLPYLEELPLSREFSLEHAYNSQHNRRVGGVPLPGFLCPSTSRTLRRGPTTGDRNGNGRWDPGDDLAYTDYGGLFGVSFPTPRVLPEHQGVLIYEKAIRARDVRDGLSRTAIVGECTGRDERFASEWVNGQNLFDQTHNQGINRSQDNELWSDHPGGVQVVFCDAHVRFLPETIDQSELLALLTRRGAD